MFLTAAYPLSERSAVNVKGEANLLNVTAFESAEEADLAQTELGEVGGFKSLMSHAFPVFLATGNFTINDPSLRLTSGHPPARPESRTLVRGRSGHKLQQQ